MLPKMLSHLMECCWSISSNWTTMRLQRIPNPVQLRDYAEKRWHEIPASWIRDDSDVLERKARQRMPGLRRTEDEKVRPDRSARTW